MIQNTVMNDIIMVIVVHSSVTMKFLPQPGVPDLGQGHRTESHMAGEQVIGLRVLMYTRCPRSRSRSQVHQNRVTDDRGTGDRYEGLNVYQVSQI